MSLRKSSLRTSLCNNPMYHLTNILWRRYAKVPPAQEPVFNSQHWQRCEQLAARLVNVQQRGWRVAARRVSSQLGAVLNLHLAEIQQWQRELVANQSSGSVVTVRTLHEELRAIQNEFGDFEFDESTEMLSIVTERITLEDIPLGSFKIQLAWNSLPGSPAYDVIALEANSASSNQSVTHPHVQDGVLCAGEAKVPITRALAEGRLLDFFQIVDQTLKTYNASSPFVSLDDWYGIPCADCDAPTSEDYRSRCSGCECTICDECAWLCCQCNETLCSHCSRRCSACEECHCRHCLEACPNCSERVCRSCRDRPNERCELCHEETSEDQNQSQEAENHSQAAASQVETARVTI